MSQISPSDFYQMLQTANEQQTRQISAQIQQSEVNITTKLNDAKRRISKLENTCLYLERRARKNNIVIFGFEIQCNKSIVQEVLDKLNSLLNLNIAISDVNNIYKIGKTERSPIIVEFISYLKKIEIFQNPEKLRALKSTNIAISNDLCEKDRNDRKILLRYYKKAKDDKQDVKIRGNKLELNSRLYTIRELEDHETESDDGDSENDSESGSVEESDVEQGTTNQEGGVEGSTASGNKRSETSESKKVKTAKKRHASKTPSPQIPRTTRHRKKGKYVI